MKNLSVILAILLVTISCATSQTWTITTDPPQYSNVPHFDTAKAIEILKQDTTPKIVNLLYHSPGDSISILDTTLYIPRLGLNIHDAYFHGPALYYRGDYQWLPIDSIIKTYKTINSMDKSYRMMNRVIHKKTGKEYWVIFDDVINATNSCPEDARRYVMYMDDEGKVFTREKSEFDLKFDIPKQEFTPDHD